jgi:hypothetical protein
MPKSNVYLLDFNVLIALASPEHNLNPRAAAWFRKGHRFATCPITQGVPSPPWTTLWLRFTREQPLSNRSCESRARISFHSNGKGWPTVTLPLRYRRGSVKTRDFGTATVKEWQRIGPFFRLTLIVKML